jgi:hypothetical protein
MVQGQSGLPAVLGLLALTWSLASAEPASNDPVLHKGLQHTEQGRDLVSKTIAITNDLLANQDTGLELTGSWAANQPTASVEAVPVHLVSAPRAAWTTPAAAPKSCRCVFVNPAAFQAFMDAQTNGPGRMQLDAKYVLTFMLLHEVGHIKRRSSATDFENGELAQLNTSDSLDKAAEKEADQFAADAIRAGLKKGAMLGIEAAWVSHALVLLSWNMQAFISLDNFGATAVGAPAVFFDKNLSHPNLIWRVLSVNHLIQQTEADKKLLESFEAARERGANPAGLYVKPGSTKK